MPCTLVAGGVDYRSDSPTGPTNPGLSFSLHIKAVKSQPFSHLNISCYGHSLTRSCEDISG